MKYHLSPRFWSAIQHYGWENFSHEILEDNLTKDQADQKEKYYIKKYDFESPINWRGERELTSK